MCRTGYGKKDRAFFKPVPADDTGEVRHCCPGHRRYAKTAEKERMRELQPVSGLYVSQGREKLSGSGGLAEEKR